MPRVAEHRPPAVPSTDEQRDRVARILRAAARQGAAQGIERVQMAEVAAEAGVALATMYRYFPSKAALFVGVMRSQVEQVPLTLRPTRPDDPAGNVGDLLVSLGDELLSRPLLAHAMLTSNNQLVTQSNIALTDSFKRLLEQWAGLTEPTTEQQRRIRIIEQAWYGILISALNEVITRAEVREDTRMMCRLILGDLAVR